MQSKTAKVPAAVLMSTSPPACGRRWRPDLQLVEVNGARRGALPGGDARHMLLQDSLLGALAVQVIWGLLGASRTLGTLDQR